MVLHTKAAEHRAGECVKGDSAVLALRQVGCDLPQGPARKYTQGKRLESEIPTGGGVWKEMRQGVAGVRGEQCVQVGGNLDLEATDTVL